MFARIFNRGIRVDNGTITDALIDVCGFLGMGVRSVSFPVSQPTVQRATDGSERRIHLDTTEKKLRPLSFYDN